MTDTASHQTIFAPASSIQKSGVAVIRISGEKAGEALKLLTKKPLPPTRKATLTGLYCPFTDELIDKALVLWFAAPASFSGGDTAELHTHGSVAVITLLLETLGKIDGLRLASPGEFSKRAFENQKMDLTEAEGLADLIEAETSLQAKQALAQMQGNLHILYDHWRSSLIKMQALLEAYIDFPDEDIPTNIINKIEKDKKELQNNIKTHLSDDRRGERLRNGLQVVILGPPNAGKSSLLNLLANRDVAIVSDTAGTTRDVIDVHLDISGYPVTLSDTAGLRENAESIEQEGIRRALERADRADLKLLMLDATDDSGANQELINSADEQTILVFNKTDALTSNESLITCSKPAVFISVSQQTNIQELLDKLKSHAMHYMGKGENNAPVVTRARHRQLLERTAEHLVHFDVNADIVLAAEELRSAAHALGQIIGRIDVEDILDELFSQFCIGK